MTERKLRQGVTGDLDVPCNTALSTCARGWVPILLYTLYICYIHKVSMDAKLALEVQTHLCLTCMPGLQIDVQ